MKKLVFSMAACLLGAVLVTLAYWPRPGVTAQNLSHIKPGMSRAQVERLIGAPPGDYRTKDRTPLYGSYTYVCDELGVYVQYRGDRVTKVYVCWGKPVPVKNWLDYLRP